MEKSKLIRAKTKMTHKKKIAVLAKESLLSLVLSLSLKPIIADFVSLIHPYRDGVAASDHHESAQRNNDMISLTQKKHR